MILLTTAEKYQENFTYVIESENIVDYKLETHEGFFCYDRGSAFLLKGIGMITNAHMFLELKELPIEQIILTKEYPFTVHRSRYSNEKSAAKLVAIDFSIDIAILQVEGMDISINGFDYCENVKNGDSITVLGYPDFRENQELRCGYGEIMNERTHILLDTK
ncbi:S1 family peptidase [Listeria seeligeri]|nr:serine protease [Listeria seeligeri]